MEAEDPQVVEVIPRSTGDEAEQLGAAALDGGATRGGANPEQRREPEAS